MSDKDGTGLRFSSGGTVEARTGSWGVKSPEGWSAGTKSPTPQDAHAEADRLISSYNRDEAGLSTEQQIERLQEVLAVETRPDFRRMGTGMVWSRLDSLGSHQQAYAFIRRTIKSNGENTGFQFMLMRSAFSCRELTTAIILVRHLVDKGSGIFAHEIIQMAISLSMYRFVFEQKKMFEEMVRKLDAGDRSYATSRTAFGQTYGFKPVDISNPEIRARSYQIMAYACRMLGHLEAAELHVQKALDLDRNHKQVWQEAVSVRVDTDDISGALDRLRDGLHETGGDRNLWALAADVLARVGRRANDTGSWCALAMAAERRTEDGFDRRVRPPGNDRVHFENVLNDLSGSRIRRTRALLENGGLAALRDACSNLFPIAVPFLSETEVRQALDRLIEDWTSGHAPMADVRRALQDLRFVNENAGVQRHVSSQRLLEALILWFELAPASEDPWGELAQVERDLLALLRGGDAESVRHAFDMALESADRLFEAGRHDRALPLYQALAGIARQLRRGSLLRPLTEDWLRATADLAPRAAWSALQLDRPEEAVALLEDSLATRAADEIPVQQDLITRLRACAPDAAARLEAALETWRALREARLEGVVELQVMTRQQGQDLPTAWDTLDRALEEAGQHLAGFRRLRQGTDFDDLAGLASRHGALLYLAATPETGFAILVSGADGRDIRTLELPGLTSDAATTRGGAFHEGFRAFWRDEAIHAVRPQAAADVSPEAETRYLSAGEGWLRALDDLTGWLGVRAMAPLSELLAATGVTDLTLLAAGPLAGLPLHAAWWPEAVEGGTDTDADPGAPQPPLSSPAPAPAPVAPDAAASGSRGSGMRGLFRRFLDRSPTDPAVPEVEPSRQRADGPVAVADVAGAVPRGGPGPGQRRHFLFEDLVMSRAISARSLDSFAGTGPADAGDAGTFRVVTFDNPVFGDGETARHLRHLPGAGVETVAVATIWRGRGSEVRELREGAATREALLAALEEADVVHYAWHAVSDPTNPWEGNLLPLPSETARWARRDLTAREIAGTARCRSRLLFLGGCETGMTGAALPGEAIGLPLALHLAGAGSVIATGWPVADGQMPVLARRFHELWPDAEASPRTALARLQREWLRGDLAADTRTTATATATRLIPVGLTDTPEPAPPVTLEHAFLRKIPKDHPFNAAGTTIFGR